MILPVLYRIFNTDSPSDLAFRDLNGTKYRV